MRIRQRMDEELASHPGSGAAAYWIAAAARAQGDLQAAWDAAQAGWVRARLASDKGAALRADLDRLVLRAIVPDRAKATAQSAGVASRGVGALQGELALRRRHPRRESHHGPLSSSRPSSSRRSRRRP